MSLYSGIKFSLTDGSASSSIASSSKDSTKAPLRSDEAASSSKPAAPALASAGFSAALKFAPRLNKNKPPPPKVPATTFNAGVLEKQASLLRAVPERPQASGSGDNGAEVQLGADGRPIAAAPSMTIKVEPSKEPRIKRDRDEERRRQKKKKKRRQQQQLMVNFDPEEAYDPSRPNDLVEYQQYRKRLRAERKARILEEQRRRDQGESSEGSYYTDSEEEAPRRDAPRMFAPPRVYSPPASNSPSAPTQTRPPSPPPQAPPLAAASTGEDAYARRLAMSSMQASTGDDAYARRLAMSRGSTLQHVPPPSEISQPPPPPPPAASFIPAPPPPASMPPFAPHHSAQSVKPPSSMPPFAPSTGVEHPPAMPHFPPANNPAMPPFPPAAAPPGMPPYPPASSISMNSPAPSLALPPFPPVPPAVLPPFAPEQPVTTSPFPPASIPSSSASIAAAHTDDFSAALEERKKAAAAIAAKFGNIPAAKPKMEDLTGTFAEKMMKRWGHVEGQGIGARADGIVHALATEHVAKPTDPNKILSKRQIAKQKIAAANAKSRKWVQAPLARGRIVDASAEARAQAERDKLGEASRIVCLLGLVESEEEVDEEMPEEIGQECSKFGIVERVVLHMVEPAPVEASECLRVFVVFSGMAGAWRAVKEMDGRFFGGRKIRAVYFDEGRFDRGDRDGPLL